MLGPDCNGLEWHDYPPPTKNKGEEQRTMLVRWDLLPSVAGGDILQITAIVDGKPYNNGNNNMVLFGPCSPVCESGGRT